MKNILKVCFFFSFTPLFILASLAGLALLESVKEPVEVRARLELISPLNLPANVYAALPGESPQVVEGLMVEDARPLIIANYLKKYNSEMKPYEEVAAYIVEISDEVGLDWRLLVAIAQQESNLGKKMPPGCNNAWGYGIHSRGTLCFDDWFVGIETVARGLKEKYIDKGLTTPEEIMKKYTPGSSGSWAFGVSQFVGDLTLGK